MSQIFLPELGCLYRLESPLTLTQAFAGYENWPFFRSAFDVDLRYTEWSEWKDYIAHYSPIKFWDDPGRRERFERWTANQFTPDIALPKGTVICINRYRLTKVLDEISISIISSPNPRLTLKKYGGTGRNLKIFVSSKQFNAFPPVEKVA